MIVIITMIVTLTAAQEGELVSLSLVGCVVRQHSQKRLFWRSPEIDTEGEKLPHCMVALDHGMVSE